jgi:hypothetical protein
MGDGGDAGHMTVDDLIASLDRFDRFNRFCPVDLMHRSAIPQLQGCHLS